MAIVEIDYTMAEHHVVSTVCIISDARYHPLRFTRWCFYIKGYTFIASKIVGYPWDSSKPMLRVHEPTVRDTKVGAEGSAYFDSSSG